MNAKAQERSASERETFHNSGSGSSSAGTTSMGFHKQQDEIDAEIKESSSDTKRSEPNVSEHDDTPPVSVNERRLRRYLKRKGGQEEQEESDQSSEKSEPPLAGIVKKQSLGSDASSSGTSESDSHSEEFAGQMWALSPDETVNSTGSTNTARGHFGAKGDQKEEDWVSVSKSDEDWYDESSASAKSGTGTYMRKGARVPVFSQADPKESPKKSDEQSDEAILALYRRFVEEMRRCGIANPSLKYRTFSKRVARRRKTIRREHGVKKLDMSVVIRDGSPVIQIEPA